MTLAISKTNVRYITGSAKKLNKVTIAIKFRVFAENVEILKAVTSLLKLKATGEEGKNPTRKFNGWDLKENLFFKEYITKNRAEFQDAFKIAKKTAIEASTKALELALTVKPDGKKAKEAKKK